MSSANSKCRELGLRVTRENSWAAVLRLHRAAKLLSSCPQSIHDDYLDFCYHEAKNTSVKEEALFLVGLAKQVKDSEFANAQLVSFLSERALVAQGFDRKSVRQIFQERLRDICDTYDGMHTTR